MRDEEASGSRWPEAPALLGILLAVAMNGPLVVHLGSQVSPDLGDPLLQSWQLGWIGHALVHDPLGLIQSNIFWPNRDSFAFTDMLLGYAPAGLVAGTSPNAALVMHNAVFLFAYALAFLGAYLLARELGAGVLGGVASGAAFAYAPWRLAQSGHLHVISSGGIPLSLFLLARGYRRGERRLVVAGWLVAAWQISLGFALGLQLAYLLLVLAVGAAAWIAWSRRIPGRSLAWTTVAGVSVFVLATVLLARPYLRVLHEYPESKKTTREIAYYSPPPRAFVAAPAESLIWGGPTAHVRSTLRAPAEQTLFPGVTVLLLAALGLGSRAYHPGVRAGLLAGTLVCAALSLGLPDVEHPDRGFTPYRFLYEFAPGWDGVRTPGRLNTLTSLGLALLAGAGVSIVLRLSRRLPGAGAGWRRAAPTAAGAALCALILLEGFGPLPHPAVPPVPAAQANAPAPQLHLPASFEVDELYTYWSLAGFPEIVNGSASFDPARTVEIERGALSFPDASSVAYLRDLGLRTVILHRDLAAGTPWQNAALRPTQGLPLRREERGDLVLYYLEPPA